jgi:hypothetical protein
MKKLGLAAIAAATLAGCAGRAPQPVAVVQPTDRFMDCTAILAEVQANNEKVKQLASDKGLKTAQNVAAGVAGFVVPVLWFGMDFQGTADTEITALQNRQQYLAMMADQKHCGAEPEPPPPPAVSSKARGKSKPRAPAQSAAAPAAEQAEEPAKQ